MLPSLCYHHYRRVREFVKMRDGRKEMFGHMNATTHATACPDHCMSGPFAFAAAAAFLERMAAAASLRGLGSIATPVGLGSAFVACISRWPNDRWAESL